jgi:predicted flap endonuclease-1-like 5' DNA nuclease
MFGLDPLSRPIAITEILLMLAFAAFVGWLLARLLLNGRINALRADIADKEAELEECRQVKTGVAPARTVPVTPAVKSEPESEPVSTYVSADPLLPAFSHDDTPDPVAADGVDSSRRNNILPETPVVVSGLSNNLPMSGTSMPGTSMPGNSEAAVLNRIAARANEVNFDRIGRATAAEADDLKDIVGIGPFLERKLHSLGIYTFRQVANFTKEDVDKINSIIEFFPGRIERDNWVDQSKSFHERKYSQQN